MWPKICFLSPFDDDFPPVTDAAEDPDGLLAVGGDLSPHRLVKAYQQGIFPWYSENEPILWWSPKHRGVLMFDDFYINRSFSKFLKKNPYRVTVNQAFSDVICHCSTAPRKGVGDGTWITGEMINAYIQLHQLGFAHSVEVWLAGDLVGGLYGVMVGGCFCGESMFHLKSNASRVAYWALVNWLRQNNAKFIDCQMQNDFLKTLGVSEIPRELYLKKLNAAKTSVLPKDMWRPQTIVST